MMKFCEIKVDDLWVVTHIQLIKLIEQNVTLRCIDCHQPARKYATNPGSTEKPSFEHKAANPACKYDDNPLIAALTN